MISEEKRFSDWLFHVTLSFEGHDKLRKRHQISQTVRIERNSYFLRLR